MKRKKSSARRVAISFAITLLVLCSAAAIGLLIFSSGNGFIIKHVTGNVPSYGGILGEFAPPDAVQESYTNFTAVREINATALPSGNYLEFLRPSTNVTLQSVEQRVSVVLSSPNATVDITQMTPAMVESVQTAFSSSLTPVGHSGSHDIFTATAIVNMSLVPTWIAFVHSPDAMVISSSKGTAEAGITSVLSVFDGHTPSLLNNSVTGRLLYVANGTDGHLGVAIQNYPGAITTGTMTLITVDELGGSLAINHLVAFSNQSLAQSQTSYFKSAYLGSEKFESYDDILVAVESQPLRSIVSAISLVG